MNFELDYCGGVFYLVLSIIAYIYIDRLYYGNRRSSTQAEAIKSAVLAEREACAEACMKVQSHIIHNASEGYKAGRDMGAASCCVAIRERRKNDR